MHGRTFSIIVPSRNHPKFPIKIQLPTSASGTITDNAHIIPQKRSQIFIGSVQAVQEQYHQKQIHSSWERNALEEGGGKNPSLVGWLAEKQGNEREYEREIWKTRRRRTRSGESGRRRSGGRRRRKEKEKKNYIHIYIQCGIVPTIDCKVYTVVRLQVEHRRSNSQEKRIYPRVHVHGVVNGVNKTCLRSLYALQI